MRGDLAVSGHRGAAPDGAGGPGNPDRSRAGRGRAKNRWAGRGESTRLNGEAKRIVATGALEPDQSSEFGITDIGSDKILCSSKLGTPLHHKMQAIVPPQMRELLAGLLELARWLESTPEPWTRGRG